MYAGIVEKINTLSRVNSLGLDFIILENAEPDNYEILNEITQVNDIKDYKGLAKFLLRNKKVIPILKSTDKTLKSAYDYLVCNGIRVSQALEVIPETVIKLYEAYKDSSEMFNNSRTYYYWEERDKFSKGLLKEIFNRDLNTKLSPEQLYNYYYGKVALKVYNHTGEVDENTLTRKIVKPYAKKLNKLMVLSSKTPELLDLLDVLYDSNIVSGTFNIEDPATMIHLIKDISTIYPSEELKELINIIFKESVKIKEMKSIHYKITNHEKTCITTFEDYLKVVYASTYDSFFSSGKFNSVMEREGLKRNLVIYSLRNGKRAFIRLIEENWDLFNQMREDILLFESSFRKVVNLNTLNRSNLGRIIGMRRVSNGFWDAIPEGTKLTFDEFDYLATCNCILLRQVYHKLNLKVDDKLKSIKELPIISQDVLSAEGWSTEECRDMIVEMLNKKPLSSWVAEEGRYLRKCSTINLIKYFMNFDKYCKYAAQVKTESDLKFLFNVKDYSLLNAKNLTYAKRYYYSVDGQVKQFINKLDLSPEFVKKNEDNIYNFAGDGMIEVFNSIYDQVNSTQKTNLKLLTKAHLAGQYKKIKFYGNDLDLEIGLPVGDNIRQKWANDIELKLNGVECKDSSDFETTLKIGEEPVHSCLSWRSGSNISSLLALCDSNKKLALAYKTSGNLVGRAMLRLSKGCSEANYSDAKLKIRDIEEIVEETMTVTEQNENEKLILFLERPYITECRPEEERNVMRGMLKVAQEKAVLLNAEIVLASDYHEILDSSWESKSYNIYISFSKNGCQYLDSLGGKNSVESEGKYQRGTFYMKKPLKNI